MQGFKDSNQFLDGYALVKLCLHDIPQAVNR